jgi:hypothetical protein
MLPDPALSQGERVSNVNKVFERRFLRVAMG